MAFLTITIASGSAWRACDQECDRRTTRRPCCASLASAACAVLLFQRRTTKAFFLPTSTQTARSFGRPCGDSLAAQGFSPNRFYSKAFMASENINEIFFPQLHNKTLVSIQDCIDASSEENRRRKLRQTSGETWTPNVNVVFVDGSWYHKPDPATGHNRDPSREYAAGPRLPGARYLDIDAVASTREMFPDRNPKGLPHMMPPPRLFGLAMDAYGIHNEDHVIVYARQGARFTPRVWFLFVSLGHDPGRVHLMQGSLEDYVEGGGLIETFPLSNGESDEWLDLVDHKYLRGSYNDCFNQGILNVTRLHHNYYSIAQLQYNLKVSKAMNICGKEEVLETISHYLELGSHVAKRVNDSNEERFVIIDTRGSSYAKKGHLPSAIHLPYTEIATRTNLLIIQPTSTLEELFEERGIDYLNPELKIILSCGSGVSVCHGYLALKELGREMTEENTKIYDGSWAEWGKEDGLPKIIPEEVK